MLFRSGAPPVRLEAQVRSFHADHPKTRLSFEKNPGAGEELRAEAIERSTENEEAESDGASSEIEASLEYVDDADEVEAFGLKLETECWWRGSKGVADRELVDAEKRRPRKLDKTPVRGAEDPYAGRRSTAACYRDRHEHASRQETPAP